jgi:hypothetical protein
LFTEAIAVTVTLATSINVNKTIVFLKISPLCVLNSRENPAV